MESSARVSVRGSLGEQLVEILKKEGEDGPPRCYILDPKCIGQISSFRSVPVGDSSIYKTLSSILFEKGRLRACDVVILPDGRSSKNTTVINKEILKPGRASKHLPARASVQIRLMYHNKEFNPETGYFAKGKARPYCTRICLTPWKPSTLSQRVTSSRIWSPRTASMWTCRA